MGRQIQVALTPIDEEAFLSFLHNSANIVLLESFSKDIEGLWKNSFEPERFGHWQYYIWNKAFAWKPEYEQVGERAYYPEHIGWYYVTNTEAAPLVEFCRSDVYQSKYGRIYWAKYFSAPNGLDYDVEQFTEWYDKIVRWIKRSAAGNIKDGLVIHFLPDAWRIRQEQKNLGNL